MLCFLWYRFDSVLGGTYYQPKNSELSALNVFYQWWIIYKQIRETSEGRKKAFSLRFTEYWNIYKEQLNHISTMGN